MIARRENGGMRVLTLDAEGEVGGKEMMPVFSFEEEAGSFIRLKELGESGWRVRRSGSGEVLSLLSGLYRGVKRVALDPLPEIGSRTLLGLFTVGRRVFMDRLATGGRRWFYREVYGEAAPGR